MSDPRERVLPTGGLTLERQAGEKIVLDNGNTLIVVNLMSIRDGQARLQIAGPREWNIDRFELWVRKERERVGAATEAALRQQYIINKPGK